MNTITIRTNRKPMALSLRFLGGVLLTLAIALAIFVAVMQPRMEDLQAMIQYLAITAVISVVAGVAFYRLGWFRYSPSIRWTILSSYGLSALLTFVNVWTTARLMFIDSHDLKLATILLVFASGHCPSPWLFCHLCAQRPCGGAKSRSAVHCSRRSAGAGGS